MENVMLKPRLAIEGTRQLTNPERGVYWDLIHLMYMLGDALHEDDRWLAGHCSLSVRSFRTIKESLVTKGKLHRKVDETGSKLFANRVMRELKKSEEHLTDLRNRGQKGGKKSGETRKNKALAEAGASSDDEAAGSSGGLQQNEAYYSPSPSPSPSKESSTDREESQPPPAEPPSKSYRFAGKVIKLNDRDFESWQQSYHGIPDLEAELRSLDDFYASKPSGELGNWFVRCSGALAKKHQAAMASGGPARAQPGDQDEWRQWAPQPELDPEQKRKRDEMLGVVDKPRAPPDPEADPDWMKLPEDLDRRPKNKLA